MIRKQFNLYLGEKNTWKAKYTFIANYQILMESKVCLFHQLLLLERLFAISIFPYASNLYVIEYFPFPIVYSKWQIMFFLLDLFNSIKNSLQQIYMMDQLADSSKKVIRNNREKMRLNIKHSNMKLVGSIPNKLLKPEPETQDSVGMKRRRKTSENIKDFDYMSIFKDKTINQSFEDLYELGEKLGEGAQSVVYKCIQKQSSKQYAVKVSKKRDLQLLQNMRINYQIIKELNHDSIIKGQYLFLDQKKLTCHMIMENYPHPQLREYMKKTKGNVDQMKVANIIYTLLDCCDYMQEKGVCHRDIKPQNILYDEENQQIKLIDFQIARMQRYSHEKLELMTSCGTLYYRAPETFKQTTYGIPVDIWGVGIIMFQLLTGVVPFKTGDFVKTVEQIRYKQINFEEYNISPSAIHLLRRMLQKSPQNRIHLKEALSSPFILKNLSKKNLIKHQKHHFSKHQSSHVYHEEEQHFSDNTSDDDEENKEEFSKFTIRVYNQDTKFNFQSTLDKDIGVRRCESLNVSPNSLVE